MNLKSALTITSVFICAGSLFLVRAQRQELIQLQANRQPSITEANSAADGSPSGDTSLLATPGAEPSSELLRLRSEVTRLTGRKRELARVPAESEALNRQRTNAGQAQPGGTPLPPGYIRKTQAQMVGYNTPEDTIQTFVYALQHHDLPTLLRSLTPAMAQIVEAQVKKSGSAPDEFFKQAEAVPGLRIIKSDPLPDGSVELELEVVPGSPSSKMQLQQTDGEWKMASPL